jgi:glyoxylase-like metal-dependent hydrolase (beta-lactamase superfamily II)
MSENEQTASPAPIVCEQPVEVSDGVFVIPDGRVPLVPNVGIVIGGHGALVVDTGMGRRSASFVLEQAKRLAGDLPLYLTITHFHPEHGFGAQVFEDEATIIYNGAQRDELRRKGAGYIEMFKGLFGPNVAAELEDVELVDPHITYDGQVEIDLGGHRAVLRSFGLAHTRADQIVLVDGRVLFGGDLFETRMFPIVPYFPPDDVDVDGSRWINVLDQLLVLDPAVVVPGHGEVTDATLIRDVREYLTHVRAETGRLRADGRSSEDAVAEVEGSVLARWGDWDNPEWIGFAVRSFYDASAAA